MSTRPVPIGGPWFEDLHHGQVFDDAPAVTLTSGHAAVHGAVFGDRLRLPLDAELCRAVTGHDRPLAHPSLVCNLAIGQTTVPSTRVIGNLFYRGLVLQRPVHLGDTLRTTTKIVALRQNARRPDRPATGLAVFEIHVANQRGETVLRFWRCPMLPCRSPEVETGHADALERIEAAIDLEQLRSAVPTGWRLDAFRERVPGAHFDALEPGTQCRVESRDTVTCAPEIARMTLNVAGAHTDAGASHHGRRLVYGGHAISTAAAQLVRALPNLVTLLAWRSCDHTAPVFEGDVLRSEIDVEAKHPLANGGGLVDFRARVHAERGPQSPDPGTEIQVLDWRAVGLMA
ncbi:MAG: MaoC family dehydratase [Myxococcota bacterium]